MYNPEQQQPHQLMAPRMSFSSDFALEPPPPPPQSGLGRASTGDADFEFSVGSHPMMAADQLFSKGRILPLREAAAGGRGPVTLRDELRARDGNDRHRRAARQVSGTRWKELLGLRKAHREGAAENAGEASSADGHVVINGPSLLES